MNGEKPTLKSTIKAYAYLFPALIIIIMFSIYPVIRSFLMSFYTDYNFFTDTVYERGIDNFVYVFNDPNFRIALQNTFKFVIGVVPISILISLGIAMLLNNKIKGATIYRSIYFLPFVTSVVAIATVWNWIFHSNYGILNFLLGLIGIEGRNWITDPDYSMTALVIMSVWRGLGFNIVILLAGLQTVDKGLYLAAKVDGASAWHRFLTVTVPMLSPTLFFISIMSVISSFRVFTEVFALFGGRPGPGNSALTVVYYVYQKFYEEWQFGIASAAATILFAIIFMFTMIQMFVGKKLVHYK